MAGVLFINPRSGRDDCTDELRDLFSGHKILEGDMTAFAAQISEAVESGVDFVAVAGGDGTIRSAAEVLRGGTTPLIPVPAGTRNHFAKHVGIDSLQRAVDATSGDVEWFDIGDVNGYCFINNSSIGMYPKVVAGREARESRLPKWAANVAATYEQLRHGHRFRATVDGETRVAWMVFVGNGIYGDGLFDLIDRRSMDSNLLDVRVVRADKPLARTRVVMALLTGRLARSPLVHTTEAKAVLLEVDRRRVEVALDGEVQTLDPPLHYVSQAHALPVLVPPPEDADDGSPERAEGADDGSP